MPLPIWVYFIFSVTFYDFSLVILLLLWMVSFEFFFPLLLYRTSYFAYLPCLRKTYQTLLIEIVFKKLLLGFSAVSLLHQPPLRSGRWRGVRRWCWLVINTMGCPWPRVGAWVPEVPVVFPAILLAGSLIHQPSGESLSFPVSFSSFESFQSITDWYFRKT